ncbi:hypothetical protein KQH82_13485 [bacterium]|nr:hypothetical protein [bacterium]
MTSNYYTSSRASYDCDSRESGLRDDKQVLGPLVDRLRKYDDFRRELENNGGEFDDLEEITAFLREPVAIPLKHKPEEAPLTSPDRLRSLVSMVGSGHYFLDVRRTSRGLPAYSLSRIAHDYWSEYSLVVEDIYLSPGFPFADSRFARYMYMGHETYYLRMSQFRTEVMTTQCAGVENPESCADDLLQHIGHYCLSAMWHEDQRPAVVAAHHFKLPQFMSAVEILYLCLSADLCTLRVHASPVEKRFFEDVYPQQAVAALLDSLPKRDGQELTNLPQIATRLFVRLNRAFREFLETEVAFDGWFGLAHESKSDLELELRCDPCPPQKVPIYKLLFANLYRLDMVVPSLKGDDALCDAAAALESQARSIIEAVNRLRPTVSDGID